MRANLDFVRPVVEALRDAAREMMHSQPPMPAPEFVFETRENARGEKVLYFPFMAISDPHLGTRHSRAKRLSHMLEHTESGVLKAVGDIVDLEYMRHKTTWNFAPWHRQVLGHLLRKDAHFFAGNHEAPYDFKVLSDGRELARQDWLGQELYNRPVSNEAHYTDPKGRVIKIKHGDEFDDAVLGRLKVFWYGVGDYLHTPIADFDIFIQEKLGYESFSIAAGAKKIAKTVINQGMGVEKAIIRSVEADPAIDGMLYGHSHMGGIKKTQGGKLILNDGCSTEHVQAMVHDRNGTFALITWHKDRIDIEEENGNQRTVSFKELGLDSVYKPPILIEDAATRKADGIIENIFRLAPPKGWKLVGTECLTPTGAVRTVGADLAFRECKQSCRHSG
ncbi:MAG: metallophosphoesterase [Alphaproteobacteria bacterium]